MTGHDSQGGGGDESKNQTPLVDVMSHNVNILHTVHDCQKMAIVGIIKI